MKQGRKRCSYIPQVYINSMHNHSFLQSESALQCIICDGCSREGLGPLRSLHLLIFLAVIKSTYWLRNTPNEYNSLCLVIRPESWLLQRTSHI